MQTKEHAGQAAHRPTDEKSERDYPVHRDSHQGRGIRILSHGANRRADSSSVDEEMERRQGQQRGENHQ